MPSTHWLLLFALVAPGIAGQAPAPQPSVAEARVFKIFTARVQQYIKLQKAVEASLPALKPTKEVARIDEHEHALTRQFLRIIRAEFQGPEAQLARKTIRPDDASKVVVRLHVNEVYPESMPLTTTPPTLLSKLPELPPDLAYRIVGHDLTLKDTKAGLIVDLIPNAIP